MYNVNTRAVRRAARGSGSEVGAAIKMARFEDLEAYEKTG